MSVDIVNRFNTYIKLPKSTEAYGSIQVHIVIYVERNKKIGQI